jgi:hypothetical protein
MAWKNVQKTLWRKLKHTVFYAAYSFEYHTIYERVSRKMAEPERSKK